MSTAALSVLDQLTQLDRYPVADQITLGIQCGIAAACGAVVGLERELAGKQAGIRTHMLVAVAAALAVGLGTLVLGENVGDPTRVLHGIITGVGFIGAGVLIYDRENASVSGLTTATTILLVAVLGAACGLGAPVLAAAVTALAMGTLRGMKALERLARKMRRHRPAELD
jgi:putative Mg2+ transporter-C (MgtC) family protein